MINPIFTKAFNEESFIKFIQELVPGLSISKKRVEKRTGFKSIEQIAKSDDRNLDLVVFIAKPDAPLNARVEIVKSTYAVLKNHARSNALVAYISDESLEWRLSLVTTKVARTKEGVRESVSNPRRFSYVLGPNAKVNTPNRHLQGAVGDLSDLLSRFSLEVVNKEFYKQISESFIKLVGGTIGSGKNKKTYKAILKLPSVSNQDRVGLEFAVRLIGRIIFCWFLREKKSPDGVALMPKELLSLEAIAKHPDYYHQILESIFFEVLNKESKSRGEIYSSGSFSLIPYLNGGLFSPHEDDYYKRRNGEQSLRHDTLVIPDEWFVNFFNILETYNFTIDENTSFDEELSIDPEMLGRIFENLLAEINPETGESARKSTGSYYTPRAIVDYMVDESLFLYLKQQTNINEEKLRVLISYDLTDDSRYPLNQDEKQKVIDAIEKLKLLDPACGSGAFPMGALQKIVFILQQIDEDGQLWFKTQIKKASPEIRRVIEREFLHKNFDYIRKLGVIRENIYGVDFQPIATEISRLRCFLTLVVDERVDDSLENRGIEPLPNLDFKFVTANSLIGLPSGQQTTLFKDQAGIDQLKDLRNQFFNATNSERNQLKLDFRNIQNEMLVRMIKMKGGDDITHKLSTWDPFSNKVSSWFDPGWMFGVENGFNIVIENPPYISFYSRFSQLEGHRKELELLRKTFNFTNKKIPGRLNSVMFFIERSLMITKEGGSASFIIDAGFHETAYKNIRKYILENSSINYFIDKISVFENVNSDQVILSLTKKPHETEYQFRYFEDFDHAIQNVNNLILQKEIYSNKDFCFTFNKNEILSQEFVPLSDLYDTVTGVQIGIGGTRKYKETAIEDLFYSENKIDESYYPVIDLRSKNFYKYCNIKFNKFLKFDERLGYEINKYVPKCNIALGKFRDFICGCKVVVRQSSDSITASYTDTCSIAEYSAFSIKEKDGNYTLKYLIALLNSKFITVYARKNHIIKMGLKKQPQIRKKGLNLIPIKKLTHEGQAPFIQVVNKILAVTKSDDYSENPDKQDEVREYEKQIDQLVYKLYDLTPEEIEIVEGASKNNYGFSLYK